MFNTFNMGVGMVAVVAPEDAEKTIETLKATASKLISSVSSSRATKGLS